MFIDVSTGPPPSAKIGRAFSPYRTMKKVSNRQIEECRLLLAFLKNEIELKSYIMTEKRNDRTAARRPEAELDELLAELQEVEESEDECLPNYGFERKQEVISLLKDEIDRVREEIEAGRCDYDADELEQERRSLCLSLGIARYC